VTVSTAPAWTPPPRPAWFKATATYQQPDARRAAWQLANTLVPYLAIWAAAVYILRLGYPYWATLPLLLVGAGLQIRIFILFHDCTHGSFFPSPALNKVVGYLCGFLTLTPYEDWRHAHAVHHATVGDLDRRGTGDIWTMTVREYLDAPRRVRLAYRIFRHPLVTFGLGPTLIFVFVTRTPRRGSRPQDRRSVYLTDLAILAMLSLAYVTIGLGTFAAIYLPMFVLSGAGGVWLFYVQHQFEATYWARHERWDPMRAALEGSSFYRLPKVLQWFTGSIGFHHVHHVRARIPNYRLEACYKAFPELQACRTLALAGSLRSMWLDLWDEDQGRMVSFRSLGQAGAGG
jgi:omega-6 fatty acid desaturase (delta-12 desaturase)